MWIRQLCKRCWRRWTGHVQDLKLMLHKSRRRHQHCVSNLTGGRRRRRRWRRCWRQLNCFANMVCAFLGRTVSCTLAGRRRRRQRWRRYWRQWTAARRISSRCTTCRAPPSAAPAWSPSTACRTGASSWFPKNGVLFAACGEFRTFRMPALIRAHSPSCCPPCFQSIPKLGFQPQVGVSRQPKPHGLQVLLLPAQWRPSPHWASRHACSSTPAAHTMSIAQRCPLDMGRCSYMLLIVLGIMCNTNAGLSDGTPTTSKLPQLLARPIGS